MFLGFAGLPPPQFLFHGGLGTTPPQFLFHGGPVTPPPQFSMGRCHCYKISWISSSPRSPGPPCHQDVLELHNPLRILGSNLDFSAGSTRTDASNTTRPGKSSVPIHRPGKSGQASKHCYSRKGIVFGVEPCSSARAQERHWLRTAAHAAQSE
ncbi:hypothetical protein EJB05_24602, partial [Eragrostis curvula]